MHDSFKNRANSLTDVSAVVTNCWMLNVQETVDDAKVVAVIPALSEVIVDLTASTEKFYKICTVVGIEGFCLKKFISLRK